MLQFHHFSFLVLELVAKMSCVIALEGFQVSHRFVIKELTIMFETDCYQHFQFNCPVDLIIGNRDWNTIRWHQNKCGLILQDDRFLPYEVISYILRHVEHLQIFCAGHHAKQALSFYLPSTDIVDVCQEYNFKYPLTLQTSPCFIPHNPRYCSLSKARTIRTAVQIYQTQD